jgi:uncharacterized protein YggE
MMAQFQDDIAKSGLSIEDYLKHIKKTIDEIRGEWTETATKRAKSQVILNEISETITIKVRDTEKVGDIIDGLTKAGVNEVQGPNYTIDDETKVQADARDKAITDAKVKAEALAKSLGVKLVRIVNFSEGGGGYPTPMYAKAEMAFDNSAGSAAPELPKGENKYVSNVTITYEIR